MSTPKRVYEGPDPTSLLTQIWRDHGTDVVISEPERIRKGGVFGFFATSQYRVEVQSNAPIQKNNASQAPRAHVAQNAAKQGGGTMTALETMVDETTDTFERSAPPRQSFEEILNNFSSSLGQDPRLFEPPGFTPDIVQPPIRLSPRDELPKAQNPSVQELVTEKATAAMPTVGARPTGTENVTPSNGPIDDQVGVGARPDVIADVVATTPATRVIERPRDLKVPRASHVAESPVTGSKGMGSSVKKAPSRSSARSTRTSSNDAVTILRRADFPENLLRAARGLSKEQLTLETAFSLACPLPTLPRTRGSLIAIVAPEQLVISIARSIASSLRIDGEEVALARQARRTMAAHDKSGTNTPRTNARRATPMDEVADELIVHDQCGANLLASIIRRDRIGVVAVAQSESRTGDRWTRSILHALRPSATWLLVDGRTRENDIEQLARAIGGVDALMVEGITKTFAPCAILKTEIPVARLDGRVATPKAWAKAVVRARQSIQQREEG